MPSQLHKGLVRTLEIVLIFLMATLVIDVLWGVFSRHLMPGGQSSWTEELARFLLVWVSLLGASLAFEKHGHLGVDYFVGKFDPTGRKILRLTSFAIVLFFAVGILIAGGWVLVSRTLELGQLTPALGLKKGYVYLAVPISGLFVALFTLGHIAEELKRQEEEPAA